jgi:hypothetical protein
LERQALRLIKRKYPLARIAATSLRRSSGDISTGFPLFVIGIPPHGFWLGPVLATSLAC